MVSKRLRPVRKKEHDVIYSEAFQNPYLQWPLSRWWAIKALIQVGNRSVRDDRRFPQRTVRAKNPKDASVHIIFVLTIEYFISSNSFPQKTGRNQYRIVEESVLERLRRDTIYLTWKSKCQIKSFFSLHDDGPKLPLPKTVLKDCWNSVRLFEKNIRLFCS